MKSSLLQSVTASGDCHLMNLSEHGHNMQPSMMLDSIMTGSGLDKAGGPLLDDDVSMASSAQTSSALASSRLTSSMNKNKLNTASVTASTDVNWLFKISSSNASGSGSKRTVPNDLLNQSMTTSMVNSGGAPPPDTATVIAWIREVFDSPKVSAALTDSLADRLSEFKLIGRFSLPESKQNGVGLPSRRLPQKFSSTGTATGRSMGLQSDMQMSRDSSGSMRRSRLGTSRLGAWNSNLGAPPQEDVMAVSACCQTDGELFYNPNVSQLTAATTLTSKTPFRLGQTLDSRQNSPLRDIMELARQQEESLKAHMMQRDRSRSAGSRHSNESAEAIRAFPPSGTNTTVFRRDRTLSRGRIQLNQSREGLYVNVPVISGSAAAPVEKPTSLGPPKTVQWSREQDARMRAVNAWLTSPGVSNAPPPPAGAGSSLPVPSDYDSGPAPNSFQRTGTFRKSQVGSSYPVPVIDPNEPNVSFMGRTFLRPSSTSGIQQPQNLRKSSLGGSSQLQPPGFYRRV